MRKKVVVLIGLCLLVAVHVFANGASEKQDSQVIKIGVSAPLTGDLGEYGVSFQRSLDLAAENWNTKGGVLGKKIELVYGDSKGNAQEAATVAQKFTSDKSIFAEIGDFSSACCMSGQSIYDSAKMIQLSPTASHIKFAKGSPWSFEVLGTQIEQGRFMADWAYDDGVRNIAILYINSDWGVSVRDGFEQAFAARGGKVIAKEFYFDGERDYTAVLTKLRALNPDALYLASYYNDGAAISVQRERLGWELPVYCAGTVYSPKFLELGGVAVEGILTNVGFFPDDPSPAAKQFIEAFSKKYGTTPDYYGACAFDSFNVLMEAIQRAGVVESEAVRASLLQTKNHQGVSGGITFDENGDARKEYIKLTIKNGKFVAVH